MLRTYISFIGLALLSIAPLLSFAQSLIPLGDLISKNSLSKVELSPNGDFLLTAGYPDNNLQINVFDTNTQHSVTVFQAKQGDSYSLSSVLWVDQDTLVFRTYRRSQKNTYVRWAVDIRKRATRLSHKLSRINAAGYIIDPLEDEPNLVWFLHYPEKYNRDKVRVYKAHVDALVRDNFRGQQKFSDLVSDANYYQTDPKGQIRFARHFDKDDITTSYWYLDADDDWQELYTFDPYEFDFEPIGFLDNGKLAVITNISSDLKSLYEFDVKTQSLGKLIYQHSRYDLVNAGFSRDGQRLESIAYYDGGEWRTEYFDSAKQQLNQLAANTFKDQQFYLTSSNQAEDKAVIKVFSSTSRGQFYYWDIKANQASLIGQQNDNHSRYTFADTQVLDIKSAEGHQIEAFFTPANRQVTNQVLLVMPHGGPIGPRDHKRFDSEVQYLASRGYSVLQVNYRGSDGFGKQFKDSGRAQWGRRIEQDITSAVEHIRASQTFKQVCAIGASYGGYSSAMLAVLHPNTYDCVIARFGVFDLPLIFNDRNTKQAEFMQKIWAKVVGDDQAEMKRYSPVYFAEKLKQPVLITAGQLDTRASFEHSNRLKYVLEKHNADVEFLYYRHSRHGHGDMRSARHELAYIDDFIRRQLNLGLPAGKNAKAIVRNELRLIAKGFERADMVGIDKEKAGHYKQRAKSL
ncbi:hypothetical protein C2869_16795 [Saccharobesus litoralis]|uniref:Peptidase S9 prolyl oligopeptidase catalytic domain-containing protein n=1 Tax=Saccharobesus litoralis TaxID=2172099 RepID=A0A2S0VUU3_9ALTE|nr:prolyl oligopeptidase family serine peptidase [Saccharobesus litoralis]AWB67978.1 hypothetical protein C2869_16795 [Saccharobesus litoralis]